MHSRLFVAAISLSASVYALPSTLTRRSVTPLSSSQLAAFAPFTQFARATYCPIAEIQNWSCGQACAANADFKLTLSGGDGNAVQQFFVGYWPDQQAVVVAHEGTDPTQFESDLTDADFFLTNLDSSIFPGVASAAQAHNGFLAEHAKTANTIFTEVQSQLAKNSAQTVICVGHSLGGALAELDQLMFVQRLPKSVHVKAVTYGTPRVGNPDFANFFDSVVSDFTRVNNEKDLIPILPGRFLGFSHPGEGETHILSPGNAVACPGMDDATDAQCQIQTVPNIADGNILNHLGPYQGISLGTIYCT